MVYVVRAFLNEEGTGTFTAELETLSDAIKSATDLRRQGFRVAVIGPDGKLVDEPSPDPNE